MFHVEHFGGGENMFNFLKKRKREQPQPSKDYHERETILTGDDVLLSALLNGETITREHAMTLPAVSGAVDLIANLIASMPIKLYKYKQGKVESQDKDARVQMLNSDTGDTLDAFQLKKNMVEDYLLGKGGYCYIEWSRNDVTALKYVKDNFISIVPQLSDPLYPIYKNYDLLVLGEKVDKDCVIKLLRNTEWGGEGVGVIQEVSKALDTAYNTLLYQLGLVKTGGNKRGFLKSQRKLGQDELNALKAAWANLYNNNESNVVVLNNGLEFQEASNSSVEMQLNESKVQLQDEINSIFHIYPADFWRTFKEAIYPIVKAFETQLNKNLLLEKEKKNFYFEFDVKEIIKANITERYNAYKVAKETGFLTLNEIRRAENLDSIEGLDVVNVGLGAVLYDTNTHTYYTPNTNTTADLTGGENTEQAEDNAIQKTLIDKTINSEFEQDGNSSNA